MESDKYRTHSTNDQLALRIDDTLYRTPLDPTGLSLTITDKDGTQAGYLLYDAFGSIIHQEFAPELETGLTTALINQGILPQPATELVHLGQGRYYDPSFMKGPRWAGRCSPTRSVRCRQLTLVGRCAMISAS